MAIQLWFAALSLPIAVSIAEHHGVRRSASRGQWQCVALRCHINHDRSCVPGPGVSAVLPGPAVRRSTAVALAPRSWQEVRGPAPSRRAACA